MRWLAVGVLLAASTAGADNWDSTCSLLGETGKYSCDGIEPPAITRVLGLDGTVGQFTGGKAIKISRKLKGVEKDEAIIHEMVHYILSELDLYHSPGPASEICASESIAWDVSNRYLISVGRRLLVTPRWWRLYKHCEKPAGLTLPESCFYLYNVGLHREWADCIGVGYK